MDPPNDWMDGKFGKALDFDGSDDRVQVADANSLDMGYGSLSVGAWFKAGASANLGTIVSRDPKSYKIYPIPASGRPFASRNQWK